MSRTRIATASVRWLVRWRRMRVRRRLKVGLARRRSARRRSRRRRTPNLALPATRPSSSAWLSAISSRLRNRGPGASGVAAAWPCHQLARARGIDDAAAAAPQCSQSQLITGTQTASPNPKSAWLPRLPLRSKEGPSAAPCPRGVIQRTRSCPPRPSTSACLLDPPRAVRRQSRRSRRP